MKKTMIVAQIKHQQAELRGIIEALEKESKNNPIIEVLKKREDEIKGLIEAIQDKSAIPRGDVSFEPQPVVEEIAEKVKKVKEGVKRLKELKKERKKILEALEQE